MTRRVGIWGFVVLFASTMGCTGFMGERPTHLVFGQRTTLGVDISPALETGDVQLVVGYKRRTATFIPSANVKTAEGDAFEREAMSVLSMGKMTVSFWRLPEIIECFATGDAAYAIAQNPTGTHSLACDPTSLVLEEGPGATPDQTGTNPAETNDGE